MPERPANAGPAAVDAWNGALVSDPITAAQVDGWQVGANRPPTTPDPATLRVARLEARLAVYAQYAAAVAEELALGASGDPGRRDAIVATRDDAAEHFDELREAARTSRDETLTFGDALTDAVHELRFQETIDRTVRQRLDATYDTLRPRGALPAPNVEGRTVPRLDLIF